MRGSRVAVRPPIRAREAASDAKPPNARRANAAVVITIDADITATATSINGSFHSAGSTTATGGGLATTDTGTAAVLARPSSSTTVRPKTSTRMMGKAKVKNIADRSR